MQLKNILPFLCLLLTLSLVNCKEKADASAQANTEKSTSTDQAFFKLSLAQWSLHKAIYGGKLDPLDFAETAKKYGFQGIEYVNNLYNKYLKDTTEAGLTLDELLPKLKAKSEEFGVENVLIMVDSEGNLADSDEDQRNQAVENHKKWVDAAAYLGCHAIRVNLNGATEKEAWISNSVLGLGQLARYGKSKGINVIVENHGGFSSNAEYLTTVMERIQMDNCGTLPDFGNFCIKRENGTCVELYDYYQGTETLMKHAKAVSAKSYGFDAEGNETTLDYPRLVKIVKDAGYTGFIGVEYEGNDLSEEEGILATKNLLLTSAASLN